MKTNRGNKAKRAEEIAKLVGNGASGEKLLTRHELARALQVSVRTVDEMTAAREIPVVRVRSLLVRFCLADVVRALTSAAVASSATAVVVMKGVQS